MTAVHLAVLRLGVIIPWLGGCSILVDANQFVSPSLPVASGTAGAASGAVETQPSFVVLGGERDDSRQFGAFATDVTYGGFEKDGRVRSWAGWTLPTAGRYVAALQSDKVWVFGDPVDTNDEMALWSSHVQARLLAPWQRTSAAVMSPWAAVVVADPDVVVIPRNVSDHPGGALSLLALQSPAELRPAGVNLLTTRLSASAALCAGHLFVVGGTEQPERDPVVLANVESAAIGPQGLGPMMPSADLQLAGAALPRSSAALACNGRRLYVVGGDPKAFQNGGSVKVLSGVVDIDGTIKSWFEEVSLLYPVSRAAAVVAAGRLVLAGGHNATRLSLVSYANLDTDGHVIDWHLEGNDELPVAVQDPAALALE